MKKELKVFDSSIDSGFKIIFNLNNSMSLKYNSKDFNSVEYMLSDPSINDILIKPKNPFKLTFYEKSVLNVTPSGHLPFQGRRINQKLSLLLSSPIVSWTPQLEPT